jgi:predicted nucleic acid-binding protein
MNVVIDTNIVVSAAFKDREPEAVIRFVIGHPQYERIASRDILAQHQRQHLRADQAGQRRHASVA